MRVASRHEQPATGSGASLRGRAVLPTTMVAHGLPSRHGAGGWPPSPSLPFLLPVLLRAQLCQAGGLWPSHYSGTRKWEGKHGAAHTKARPLCVGGSEGLEVSEAAWCFPWEGMSLRAATSMLRVPGLASSSSASPGLFCSTGRPLGRRWPREATPAAPLAGDVCRVCARLKTEGRLSDHSRALLGSLG